MIAPSQDGALADPAAGMMARSFVKLRDELAELMSRAWTWPSPEAAFAAWAHETAGVTTGLPRLGSAVLPAAGEMRFPQHAAVVGYATAAGRPVGPDLAAAWREGVGRTLGGEPFPLDRQSFLFRPTEALGLAAGATPMGLDTQVRDRLTGFLQDAASRGNDDPLSQGAYARAVRLLGGQPQPAAVARDPAALDAEQFSAALWGTEDANGEEALLERWANAGGLPSGGLMSLAVCHLVLAEATRAVTPAILAEHRRMAGEVRSTLDLLESLFRRFHVFARQLGERHSDGKGKDKVARPTLAFNDEYDVQDASHAILRLHFEDVEAEEPSPSYATNSTRVDFLLRRELVAVEQKMTRSSLSQKKLVDQLVTDIAHYQSHPKAKALFCFVYDPNGRCNNPAAIEDDLRRDGDFPVRVVVCPHGK